MDFDPRTSLTVKSTWHLGRDVLSTLHHDCGAERISSLVSSTWHLDIDAESLNQSSSKGVFFQEETDTLCQARAAQVCVGEHQSCGCARVTGQGTPHSSLSSQRCRFCCQVRGSSVKCFGTFTRTSGRDLFRGRRVLFAPVVSAFHLHPTQAGAGAGVVFLRASLSSSTNLFQVCFFSNSSWPRHRVLRANDVDSLRFFVL